MRWRSCQRPPASSCNCTSRRGVASPGSSFSQPASCVETWANEKAEIKGTGFTVIPSCCFEKRRNAGLHTASTNAFQALTDQNAVVLVEFDHIGNRAECHQIEQVGKVGFGMVGKIASFPQFCPQGEHDVEHDANPGNTFGGKGAAGLVGINNTIGIGQVLTR